MRIVTVGNSVGLRVRPPRVNREGGNFSEVLERLLKKAGYTDAFVYNRCKSALTVADLYENEFEFIVGFSPDMIIIICGINEAVARPLPRRFYQLLNKPRPFAGYTARFLFRINSGLNRIIWPQIIRTFGLSGWETPQSFIAQLSTFIDLIYKETKSPCFVFNILPCSNRVEKLLPGSQQRISAFNERLQTLCASNPNIYLIDVFKCFQPHEVWRLMPDGIHMSSELHLRVAEALKDLILSKAC